MDRFIEDHQKDISELISLQNILSNLDENNVQSSIESIKESKFIQTKDNLRIIIKIIGRLIKFRKKQIPSFFKLIDALFPIISTNFNKRELMLLLTQKIIFLKLFHDKFITDQDLIEYYGLKSAKLLYFYPEVKDLLSENKKFKENMHDHQKYKCIIEYFNQHEGQTIEFDDDPRLQVGLHDKLSVLIQKDDIDSFQQMISQNNIDIKNHQITLNDFEVNKCLNKNKIRLIEYAAYHSSLKIFKFLLMNDSPFSNRLFQYAICGGNTEIIHLAESVMDNSNILKKINQTFSLSMVFHRDELTNYLIENYTVGNIFNELSSSVFYENYSFFFNHILELNNAYNELLDKKDLNETEIEQLKKLKSFISECVVLCAGDACPLLLETVLTFKNIDLNQPLHFDIKKNDSEGNAITNPLSFAIQKFNNKNAKFLASLDSVDPDFKMFNKITPFIWACYVGNLEMVEFLSHCKNVNILTVVDESKENALHVATRLSNFEVVKYLISLNVFDLNTESAQKETAIEIAARLGYKEIFDFLKTQTECSNEVNLNDDRFYPARHINPMMMGIDFYNNLKEPIPICLLI